MFGKAIPAYIKEMVDDEQFTNKTPLGYVSVVIRKAETEGKLGEIELEAAENLPLSWMQKKDVLMQFLQAANPVVMEALISPQNLPLLAEAVGLENIELPGENDRQAQLEEIVELINSAPMAEPGMDPMTGQEMPGVPSVPIEPDVDNHEVHILICKNWLTSEAGRFAKIDNPAGYMNVLLHMKEHVAYEQMMQMQQMQMEAALGGGDKPGEKGQSGKPQNDKTMAPAKDQAHEVMA